MTGRFEVSSAGEAVHVSHGAETVRIPDARVALSTASTYPEPTEVAFELSAKLGYDGVEVMVWTDPVSQSLEELQRLVDSYGVPVLAVHSPCLLITQRVWGTDPWLKLVRAQEVAETLGADVVVVHPPFLLATRVREGLRDRHRGHARGDARQVRRREHVPVAGART